MENNENMNIENLPTTDVTFVSITGCVRIIPMTAGDIGLLNANNSFEQFKNNITEISHEVGEVICLLDNDKRSEKAEELYTRFKEPLDGFGLDMDYDDRLDKLDVTTKMIIVAHDLIHLFETLIDVFDYSKSIEMIRSILPIEEADNSPSNGLNKLSDIEIDPFDTDDKEDDNTVFDYTYGGSSDE